MRVGFVVLKVSWGEKVDKYGEKREFRGSVGEGRFVNLGVRFVILRVRWRCKVDKYREIGSLGE